MAKTRHNNLFDTIDDVISHAKDHGIVHLYSQDESFSGRYITINDQKCYHFGTTGYLGLEQDDRLKKAAIEAIVRYGTQFPLSKTYISHTCYQELEELLFQMYDLPVIVTKNSTLAHISVLPSLVKDNDAVILDHQVHASAQNASQLLKPRGIPVDMIRHNNLNMLEDRIKFLSQRHQCIYYVVDGVYSMFGDVTPIHELLRLVEKYPNFYIYVDDVHGMSWAGEHGTGYIKSQVPQLHPNMILVSTISKTFGASGGTVIIPNPEVMRKIKNFGGPLTFSAQLEPASVGAAIASAKIHLSKEIYTLQSELMNKIEYCNSLIKKTDLPLVEANNCPVFFIGTGQPSTGYNLTKRMMQEGFFVNLGVFPAVPIKNTGIRFTISRHNQLEDIKNLIDAFSYHYPKALEDEGRSNNEVRKAFSLPLVPEKTEVSAHAADNFDVLLYDTIAEIDPTFWNRYLGGNGIFDHQCLTLLEKSFSDNPEQENNWQFKYLVIMDQNKPLLVTFMTVSLWKDDLLSPYDVSKRIEEARKENKYHLTSKVLAMGSLITEGQHLYLDRNNPRWGQGIERLLQELSRLQEVNECTMTVLRDFNESDQELRSLLLSQGYFKIAMPETCHINSLNFNDPAEFLASLSANSRKHVKREVLRFQDQLEVSFEDNLNKMEIEAFNELYRQVADHNFDLNTFYYPERLFHELQLAPGWKFIVIRKKVDDRQGEPIAISANYLNADNIMTGVFLGMNYQCLESHKIYKQVLYQTIMLGREWRADKVYLGFSAAIDKRKFGASLIPKCAYVQAKDNYKLELLENMRN